jgi:hypothetical protein
MGEDADGCLYLEMELLEGQTVDARADIYSVGAILSEMLTH